MNTKVFIKSVEFRNILKTSVDRENQLHFDDNFWWLYLLSELHVKRLKSVHYSYVYCYDRYTCNYDILKIIGMYFPIILWKKVLNLRCWMIENNFN